MSTWDDALAFVLRMEGGYVNNPADPGGATNYGITQATYDDWRDDEDLAPRSVRLITRDEVAAIYRHRYWRGASSPAVLEESGKPQLAFVTFDWAVNAGPARGRAYVQIAVGAVPDGVWGPRTLDALANADDATAAARVLALRADHYRARVGQEPARLRLVATKLPAKLIPGAHGPSAQFLKGWLRRLRSCARALSLPIGPTFAQGSESLSL